MIIKEAQFVISNTDFRKCPPPDFPEFAFIGRSNVGKSTLINMLCNRKGLAKVSVQPGKTQLINHFIINNSWYLVDLPGYGYAKISKKSREKWRPMINNYLNNRLNLLCTFILVDLRIPPQSNDREVIDTFGESQWPFAIVFTKYDKMGQTEAQSNVSTYKKDLLLNWEELPPMFVSSSVTGRGRDEILTFIEASSKVFDPVKIKNAGI